MTAPRIVVLGMMTKMPVPGVVWQTVQYLEGFRRLGYEPWYVEAHAINPSMFQEHDNDPGSPAAARFLHDTLTPFGFGDRWCYQALHDDGACFGLDRARLEALYRDAELLINLHGGTLPRSEHVASERLVYLETDPVAPQVELATGVDETSEFLRAHVAHFTFGERYGQPGCGLPVSETFAFLPTRQPVVLDWWEGLDEPGTAFTTVGNWRQRWRTVTLGGEDYTWSKDDQFEKVLSLPVRTGRRFELALAGFRRVDAARLAQHGWQVRRADEVAGDAVTYRRYLGGSLAEFTAAKDQNVRLRTGWFSDRSAAYLAAGRPVVTQDTAFGELLPTGEGLLAWHDLDSAAAAVDAVAADPARHGRAARAIAQEFFEAESVLKRLLSGVGL